MDAVVCAFNVLNDFDHIVSMESFSCDTEFHLHQTDKTSTYILNPFEEDMQNTIFDSSPCSSFYGDKVPLETGWPLRYDVSSSYDSVFQHIPECLGVSLSTEPTTAVPPEYQVIPSNQPHSPALSPLSCQWEDMSYRDTVTPKAELISVNITDCPKPRKSAKKNPTCNKSSKKKATVSVKVTTKFHDSQDKRPEESFIALIAKAIMSSQEKKMLLNDIYQWILDNHPYYGTAQCAWKISVRYNLSTNECFVKGRPAPNGRGFYWSIHPTCRELFLRGQFERRNARRVVRQKKNHEKSF